MMQLFWYLLGLFILASTLVVVIYHIAVFIAKVLMVIISVSGLVLIYIVTHWIISKQKPP